MIEMGKKYQTRDGRAVRILCTDLKGCRAATVIGLVTQGSGTEYVESWMADGRTVPGWGGDNDSDLIPVPTKHEGWMVFDTSSYALYASKESAERALGQDIGRQISDVVAHVTWES